MHTDRYVPLHPQLKGLIDDHLAGRPAGLRSNLLFLDYCRPITGSKVDAAVMKAATAAGLTRISPHQLRHTLATQAKMGRVAPGASFGRSCEHALI